MLHPTFRRCIFWLHLAIGVMAGAVILLLATTGLLMSFETQIVARVERSMVREKGPQGTPPLSPEALVAKFQESGLKGRPTALNLSSAPGSPASFQLGKGNQVVFHPVTGESMGKGAGGTRRFFQTVLSIHRWLTWPVAQPEGAGREAAAEGAPRPTTWRDIGGAINGTACLVFFVLLISGLFLWIPKKLTWRAFKAVLLPQSRLKGRARDWNWHNIAGIWASPIILMTTFTGIVMFYPWANKLLFNSFGEQPPVREGQGAQPGGKGGAREGRAGGVAPIVTTGLDQAAARAAEFMPGWKTLALELPSGEGQPIVATVSDGGRGNPDRRVKLTLDRADFSILKQETFANQTPGAQARVFVRWMHTGEAFGWPGQLVVACSCACVIVLVWTGYALAWRRLSGFLRKRKERGA